MKMPTVMIDKAVNAYKYIVGMGDGVDCSGGSIPFCSDHTSKCPCTRQWQYVLATSCAAVPKVINKGLKIK